MLRKNISCLAMRVPVAKSAPIQPVAVTSRTEKAQIGGRAKWDTCRWKQAKCPRYNRRRMPELHSVVVYSRKGCHLCEVVKESLSKLSRRGGFIWREVDVDGDAELRRQYNDEVPVVFIDGRKAFKYHMNEQEFLRKLAN
jgi:glutaredoxin